jgi:hypothetical protein
MEIPQCRKPAAEPLIVPLLKAAGTSPPSYVLG